MEELGAAGILFLSCNDLWSRCQCAFFHRSYSSIGFYYPTTASGRNETYVILLDEFLLDTREIKLTSLFSPTDAAQGSSQLQTCSHRRLICPRGVTMEDCLKAFRTALASLMNSLPASGDEYIAARLATLLESGRNSPDGLETWLGQLIATTGGPELFSDMKYITLPTTSGDSKQHTSKNAFSRVLGILQQQMYVSDLFRDVVLGALTTQTNEVPNQSSDFRPLENTSTFTVKDLFDVSSSLRGTLSAIEKGETPIFDLNSFINFHNRVVQDRQLPLLEGSYAAIITSRKAAKKGMDIRVKIPAPGPGGKKEIILPTHGADLSGFNKEQLREIALFLNTLKEPDFDMLRQEIANLLAV